MDWFLYDNGSVMKELISVTFHNERNEFCSKVFFLSK